MRQRTLCLLLLLLGLAACGQKGPLYLPDAARPPADTPASAEEDEDEEGKEQTSTTDQRGGR